MWLLYQLETEMEREIPARLQSALDEYRAHCPECGLGCTVITATTGP